MTSSNTSRGCVISRRDAQNGPKRTIETLSVKIKAIYRSSSCVRIFASGLFTQPLAEANRWPGMMTSSQHVYEVRPRKDQRGVDLISDELPFGRPASQDRARTVFDCRMADDPATISKERTNENNTDVDRWADARRLRINGKPCS